MRFTIGLRLAKDSSIFLLSSFAGSAGGVTVAGPAGGAAARAVSGAGFSATGAGRAGWGWTGAAAVTASTTRSSAWGFQIRALATPAEIVLSVSLSVLSSA